MSKRQIQSLAVAGVICAVIAAFSVIPYTGYISVGMISLTTLHIPVIIGAILLGPAWGAGIGGFWGLTCLVRALIMPYGLDVYFVNPLYSVFPRIMVGLVAGLLYRLLSRAFNEKLNVVAMILSGIAGAATNTVLVLGTLSLFCPPAFKMLGGSVMSLLKIILAVGGALEILAAPFLIAAIVYPLQRTVKRYFRWEA